MQFATALFQTTDAQSLLTTLTSAVTDNLPAVLVVVGGVAGIAWARAAINRSVRKGKV